MEVVAQALKVLVRRIKHRVAHEPLRFTFVNLALDLGDLFLKATKRLCGLNGVNEERDIKHLIKIDDGREPTVGEESRIRDGIKRADKLLAEFNLARADRECGRSNRVNEVKRTLFVNIPRQDRCYRRRLVSLLAVDKIKE